MTTPTATTDLYYLGLDLETTGIAAEEPTIEVGIIITDADYNEVASYSSAIRPAPGTIDRLYANDFVRNMHTVSGLLAELQAASAGTLPTLSDAEDAILDLIDEHVPASAELVILGSGTARFDHPRVQTEMPRVAARLRYYENDPASARRRYRQVTGRDLAPLPYDKQHRSLDDIRGDLVFLREQDEVFRTHLSAPVGSFTPQERTLTGLALFESYLAHDSFHTPDGTEYATTTTGTDVHALMRGTNPLNAVAGLLSVAERLAELAGGVEGTTVQALLRSMRADALSADGPRA